VFARNAAAEASGLELPDYSRSNAILIGTSDYQDPHFPSLPQQANSLNAFKQVLSDPDLCGWPDERITVLENPVNATRVIQQVRTLAAQAEDALLVYYAGHARLANRGRLCLTISDTEYGDPDITGIEYERIADALLGSRARTRTVILDCSYAGRAAASEGPDYLLAATSATHNGIVLPGESCLLMTGRLVDVIRVGIPDGPARLTLSGIYPELRRRLQQEGLPLPILRSTEAADQPAFFTFNAAAPGAR
jgi:hypothetical protein